MLKVERTCGMIDGEAVYHLTAYDSDTHKTRVLRVYPARAGWEDGKPSKAEVGRMRRLLEAKP